MSGIKTVQISSPIEIREKLSLFNRNNIFYENSLTLIKIKLILNY